MAEAYGLEPDDFAHILTRFPGVAKKRPEFHAYLRGRVSEWAGQKSSTRQGRGVSRAAR